MWVVAKIKRKELNLLKKELKDKIGSEMEFYDPKIQYHQNIKNKSKKIEKYILENYIFCFHEKLKENKIINKIRFLRGLDYFLGGYHQNQKEILKFIKYCKSFENKNGYLLESFFKTIISKKAQFMSGPFTNTVFEIIEKQKNKLKILIGNFVTTVPDNKNYLYRSVL